MKNYIVEFIGTFFLVLVIGLVVSQGNPLAAVAIGAILVVLVYMGGHISGAHYNPAVTLACLMRGAIGGKDAAIYMLSQVIGAVAGAATSAALVGKSITVAPGGNVSSMQAVGAEFLFTFALASVVLNVATSKDHPDNSFYGLAIGFTVMAGALAVGPISGGAFNPAVALGHNIVSSALGNIWIYLVGPLAGGAVASIVFRVTNPHDLK